MTHKKTIFKTSLFALALCLTMPAAAKDKTITSPNGQLVVTLSDTDGKPETFRIVTTGIIDCFEVIQIKKTDCQRRNIDLSASGDGGQYRNSP